jgi:hypothetical protein
MVKPHFETNDLQATLEPLYQRVLERFQLPNLRLLCFFDVQNPKHFDQKFGCKYRGLHRTVHGIGYVPPHLQQHFFDVSGGFAFDNVVYLPGRTCVAKAGAVITFAHELQHFVQHGSAYKVLVANNLLSENLLGFDPDSPAKAWHIPHEQDAMLVSKRVAEAVLGTEVVSQHVESRIAAQDDLLYWQYFQNLSADSPFDLLAQTIPWVDKYRPQLLALQQTKVDFSQTEWWQ